MTLNNNGKPSGSSKASGTASISSPSIITVNGGLTGQSMNAPEREKVYIIFKKKKKILNGFTGFNHIIYLYSFISR